MYVCVRVYAHVHIVSVCKCAGAERMDPYPICTRQWCEMAVGQPARQRACVWACVCVRARTRARVVLVGHITVLVQYDPACFHLQ